MSNTGKIELFDPNGNRKYLTPSERERFLQTALAADGSTSTFCLMLHHTGCRISEALNLTRSSIDYESKCVTFKTLKQRKSHVFRQVPLPDDFLLILNRVHNLRHLQKQPKGKKQFIWTSSWKKKPKQWSRKTAYSRIMKTMTQADLNGIAATPKGLRHAFAIACLDKGLPLNLVQKWMGHASITTTSIYANASGEEERNIIAKLWQS